MNIKDFLPKLACLYKYIWKVVICIVITGKGHIGPDIWPETPNQSTNTKDMILIT